MLKFIWQPSVVMAPGDAAFARQIDKLMLRTDFGDQVVASIPRDGSAPDLTQLDAALQNWIEKGPRKTPLDHALLLVHGYQFDPASAQSDPFGIVYGVPGNPPDPAHGRPDPHMSWLPIVGECDDAGTDSEQNAVIGFGWLSEETRFGDYIKLGWNNPYLYAAFDLAPLAAQALAIVIECLQKREQKFRILAHSLGTRATSQAIGLLRANWTAGWLDRIVLMGGAEYTVDANQNLLGLAGLVTLNVANRNDQVLNHLGYEFSAPVRPVNTPQNRLIGNGGIKPGLSDWLDIQIDRQDAVAWLSHHGYGVVSEAGPGDSDIHPLAGFNHWVYYMDDGNRPFIRFLLTNPDVSPQWFRDRSFPEGIDSPRYGDFDPTVPPTPTTLDARTALFNTNPNSVPGGTG